MKAFSRAALVLVALVVSLSGVLQAAKPSLQVFFPPTMKDSTYQKRTFDRVARLWKSPPPQAMPQVGARAVIKVTILRSGEAKNVGVLTPSGSQFWDAAALNAVKAAVPFDPFPPGSGGESADVNFQFAMVP